MKRDLFVWFGNRFSTHYLVIKIKDITVVERERKGDRERLKVPKPTLNLFRRGLPPVSKVGNNGRTVTKD